MIILDNNYSLLGQHLHVFVKYDEVNHKVIDVKNIFLLSHGQTIPIGCLLMRHMKDGVLKMVEKTDWKTIYKEFIGQARQKVSNAFTRACFPST